MISLPRWTARLRLSLLYGAMFLICGAALLAVTDGLVRANLSSTPKLPSGLSAAGLAGAHPQPRPLGRPHNRPAGTAPTAAAEVSIAASNQRRVDLNTELIWSGVALGIMTVVSFALGWYVAGRVLAPVRAIARTAQTISAGNLGERVALDGPDDEFKELGDTLDQLLERLQTAFNAQRHFVANASHELRTPLTVERSLLQLALSDPNPTTESLLDTCRKTLRTNEQQHHLIEGLLTLARSEGGLDSRERCDLAEITDHVLSGPRTESDRLGVTLITTLGPAPVQGSPRLLERLAANLVDNAFRHNTLDGSVAIMTVADDQHAVLSVTNTGPAVPPEAVSRLFEPFQRLNGTRTQQASGHGLGLSIVQAIATAHGASIATRVQPGGGLSIEVSFPRRG
jgi:signal transduction histidine kinase